MSTDDASEAEPIELVQCIYASAAAQPFEADELEALLTRARAHNQANGLTGMLLYAEGSFFQVLEGPAEVVDALYRRIELDPRHVAMTKLIREPIKERSFQDWTMGFYQATRQDIARIVGLNDFLRIAHAGAGDQDGRARKLLAAFREGRWRKRITG
ncbi:MAG: BLUF domain-containing protein [Deltaproteobacteria bacterium]|nr:BLUF domain-containing protein [Deltaproteobacteria bacterium]